MNSFLLSLPAILGIVGFVIYLILKKSVTEDPIVKSVIAKLQFEEPDFANRWTGLTPKQKENILKEDNILRDKISSHDRKILDKALSNQFKINLFVYSLCGLLLIAGLYFFVRPKPLEISNIQIQNTDSTSSDLIVDIDPIIVTWTASGSDEVLVALENIETGKQTKRMRGLASDGKIKFNADNYTNYDKILSNRFPNETNRLRAIIFAANKSFTSKAFEIKVGIKIICYEKNPDVLVFNAIIDQTIIDNFHFSPRITLFKDEHFNGSTMFESEDYSPAPEIKVTTPKAFTTTNLVFTANPRNIVDQKVYRTDIESIRDALKALKKK